MQEHALPPKLEEMCGPHPHHVVESVALHEDWSLSRHTQALKLALSSSEIGPVRHSGFGYSCRVWVITTEVTTRTKRTQGEWQGVCAGMHCSDARDVPLTSSFASDPQLLAIVLPSPAPPLSPVPATVPALVSDSAPDPACAVALVPFRCSRPRPCLAS